MTAGSRPVANHSEVAVVRTEENLLPPRNSVVTMGPRYGFWHRKVARTYRQMHSDLSETLVVPWQGLEDGV